MEGKVERVEEKEVEKREKGKSGFGKSPFCFCLTVSLPLHFFPICTHHSTHHSTHHGSSYNITRYTLANSAQRQQ